LVQTFSIGSRAELVARPGDLGWGEIVVLSTGDPESVEIWGGDGHWHAQTHYLVAGRRVEVTQAGVGGLPPGSPVQVRGVYGVRSEGGLYWIEGDFVVALKPGKKALTAELVWVPANP
jgi:hypothetical protein